MSLARIAFAPAGMFLLLTGCERAPPTPPTDPGADTPRVQQSAELVRPVSLENTHWLLAQLAGQPPQGAQAERAEPYFILMSDGGRLQGFTGCNRMAGTYEAEGPRLRLGAIVSTKMACADPRNPEDGFLKALNATMSTRITGNRLELLDAEGATLASFQARLHPTS